MSADIKDMTREEFLEYQKSIIAAAMEEIVALNKGKKWTHTPLVLGTDSDICLYRAVDLADQLLRENQVLRGEIERP